MRAYYEKSIRKQAAAMGKQAEDLNVLDLCSSWTSHLPKSFSLAEKNGVGRVSGLGMNAAELQANDVLNDFVVRNLNEGHGKEALLPYEDATFDMVLCSLSVDYLVNPQAVFTDAARVLKPGGAIHIGSCIPSHLCATIGPIRDELTGTFVS